MFFMIICNDRYYVIESLNLLIITTRYGNISRPFRGGLKSNHEQIPSDMRRHNIIVNKDETAKAHLHFIKSILP